MAKLLVVLHGNESRLDVPCILQPDHVSAPHSPVGVILYRVLQPRGVACRYTGAINADIVKMRRGIDQIMDSIHGSKRNDSSFRPMSRPRSIQIDVARALVLGRFRCRFAVRSFELSPTDPSIYFRNS